MSQVKMPQNRPLTTGYSSALTTIDHLTATNAIIAPTANLANLAATTITVNGSLYAPAANIDLLYVGNLQVSNYEYANTVVVNVNVYANLFIGNGALLTDMAWVEAGPGLNSNIYATANVAIFGNLTCNTTISGKTILGNCAGATGITASQISGLSNSATLDATSASNISSGTLSSARLPFTLALGNAYANVISANAFLGNDALLSGRPWSFPTNNAYAASNVFVLGNVSVSNSVIAQFHVGNGALLTGISNPWVLAPGAANIYISSNVGVLGNLSILKTCTAATFSGNGSALSGITTASISGLATSATTDCTNASNITSGTLAAARLNTSYLPLSGGTMTGSIVMNGFDMSGFVHFYPNGDGANSCGSAGNRFNTVYATTSTINTSDRRENKQIIDSDLGLDFIKRLRPVSYRWAKESSVLSGKFYGFIAQDVKAVIDEVGVDFAGWTIDEPDGRQGLRYTEFIAPIVQAIQELNARIDLICERQ